MSATSEQLRAVASAVETGAMTVSAAVDACYAGRHHAMYLREAVALRLRLEALLQEQAMPMWAKHNDGPCEECNEGIAAIVRAALPPRE